MQGPSSPCPAFLTRRTLFELVGFLLPALLFSVFRSEAGLYITLLLFFVLHKVGLNAWYKRAQSGVAPPFCG